MKIELINTGTELLIGDVVNTNAAWLGQTLLEIGVEVSRSCCVPDGDAIEQALAEACGRADVVMVTGGLGPTSDDVSREGASAVFGLPLEMDDEAMAGLEAYFSSRGKTVSENNRRQALKPRGAEVLPNANGTAPGLYLPAELGVARGLHTHVFLLPGPPRELKPMMVEQVMPKLRRLVGGGEEKEFRYFKFCGLGESTIAMALQEELEAVGEVEIGYCLGKGDVDVRLRGTGEALAAASRVCREKLGEYLVSEDKRVMEEVVVAALKEKGEWVATAESCTGGFIASRLTDVSGASAVFGQGLVTYANEAKTKLLGVPAELIREHGAVSVEVAEAMARGCLEVSGADHAIAVSGIAGPGGGSVSKPVGLVYVALASKGYGVEVRRRVFPGGRDQFKILTSQAALDFLRRRLQGVELPKE